MFLMMTAKVWANDEKNMDGAVQKVRELRPFRSTDFDMLGMLARGEAAIAIIDAPQASRLKQQGVPIEFVVPLEGMFMFEQDTNVPVGAKNKPGAYAFVNYMLSAKVQEKWVQGWFVTPANRTVRITNEQFTHFAIRVSGRIHRRTTRRHDSYFGGLELRQHLIHVSYLQNHGRRTHILKVRHKSLACRSCELGQFKPERRIRNAENCCAKLRALRPCEVRHVLVESLRLRCQRISRSHLETDHIAIERHGLFETVHRVRKILQLDDRRRRSCLCKKQDG